MYIKSFPDVGALHKDKIRDQIIKSSVSLLNLLLTFLLYFAFCGTGGCRIGILETGLFTIANNLHVIHVIDLPGHIGMVVIETLHVSIKLSVAFYFLIPSNMIIQCHDMVLSRIFTPNSNVLITIIIQPNSQANTTFTYGIILEYMLHFITFLIQITSCFKHSMIPHVVMLLKFY